MKQTKKIIISRTSDYSGGSGFGFTLRHYIVYPSAPSIHQASYGVVGDEPQCKQLEGRPTTTMHLPSPRAPQGEQQRFFASDSLQIISADNIDDDQGAARNENLPPLETIFVKEVRRDSPAYRAGLRQADRILSVNEQSIYGKTYAQVIAIIQNTPHDLVLSVLPQDDDRHSLNSPHHHHHPSPAIMSTNTIEQKLRNLQINLAQGRTQEELAQAGIYFPSPNSSSSPQNVFSNYIDSVHKALDSSKPSSSSSKDNATSYYQSPFHNEYIPYDYKQGNSFLPMVNSSFNLSAEDQAQWALASPSSSRDDVKSPSSDSLANEKDKKTDFVDFRKKQFETGHVENLVRDTQRDSKTKKYSEKKKYENEWNRLTATAEVESVMTRASHFEEIDPNKFVKFKSKPSDSPAASPQENVLYQEENPSHGNPEQVSYYESQFKMIKPVLTTFNAASTYQEPRVEEINHIEYNYEPRYMLEPLRTASAQRASTAPGRYAPLATGESQRYTINSYSSHSPLRAAGVNLIRQDSYITAVRSAHPNEPAEFVHLHACDHFAVTYDPETPVLRRQVSPYGVTPRASEQDLKQRRTSYLIATDQRMANRTDYMSSDYMTTDKEDNYAYGILQEQQKARNTSQHQSQAIKKLKNFFGEGTPEVTHALDLRSSLSPQSSSGCQSKSGSYFDSSTTTPQESISLSTMADHIEASKEGILYCKTVLKEGRRAIDRSWRGAWAVLRRGALFLGKEKKHGLLIPLSCDSFPINLHNAEVELASDYVKKPRVFKLSTSNQSEFLFQAPDLQSLSEWLDVIHENCTPAQDNQEATADGKEKPMRKSSSSLVPLASTSQQDLISQNDTQHKLSPTQTRKSKLSLRSPSLKRSPSLRFRKSQKPTSSQSTQPLSSLSGLSSPSSISPRRSFVKSIVKKGLRTLKSSSSILTSQMSGQFYDESSGEYSSPTTGTSTLSHGTNFGIELEECEASSISRYIPIVVEILTRLVELRGINCQGIYRHAGGLTAVNWLVAEFDKGAERIDFNSEKWYDVKAIASTLKTFFAKLPDSLLSSKTSSLLVEASRLENHRNRVFSLKQLIVQLDDYRFETLKYLCAHFRRVASNCSVNKIDARNLAIIFGPTLIWDSKASLQSNLIDNPEKIRIIESFILYYEWFFDYNGYDDVPPEINPQMPKLPPVLSIGHNDSELSPMSDTKPSEIIQQIVRAAKRRWSSPLLLDSLSSLSTNTTDQQASKPINISVKRNRRRDTKKEAKSSTSSSRSRSVDSSLQTNQIVSSSTDSAVYSMSDISSSVSTTATATTTKKPSQSLRDISHIFHYFTLSNDKHKAKTLSNIRRKKLRKKVTDETFLLVPTNKDDEIYERISNSSICFIDQSPVHEFDLAQQTSLLKSKLLRHESLLHTLKQQIHEVDQQIFIIKEDSIHTQFCSSSDRQIIKRRHTFNSLLDLDGLLLGKEKSSSSSLYALQLL